MKQKICKYLRFLCLLLFVCLFVEVSFGLDTDSLKKLDPRLPVLLKDESIWEKIDQREIFIDEAKYKMVLDRSFDSAARILPSIFDKSNRKNFENISTCLHDSKIFVRLKMDNLHLIGWIPIAYLDEFDKDANITLLAIPSSDEGRLLSVFLRESKANDLQTKAGLSSILSWVNTNLLEHIGINLEELSEGAHRENELRIKGKIIRPSYAKRLHDISIYIFADAFLVRTLAYPPGTHLALPRLTSPRGEMLLKPAPTRLSFWPPAESN